MIFSSLASNGQQEKAQFVHKGLFRSVATLSFGSLLKEKTSMIYGQGNIEYYVAANVSLRGESFFSVGKNNFVLDFNHSVFAGANFHFKTKNHFDPYIGLLYGVSIAKAAGIQVECFTTPCPPLYNGSKEVGPLISVPIGFNFYFEKLFHLFAEVRYVYGNYISNYPGTISLSEIRFSFGLGWNLNFKRKEEQK